jgi:hypothetical protein
VVALDGRSETDLLGLAAGRIVGREVVLGDREKAYNWLTRAVVRNSALAVLSDRLEVLPGADVQHYAGTHTTKLRSTAVEVSACGL